MYVKVLLLFSLAMFAQGSSKIFAQSFVVTGRVVTQKSGEPLSGATVAVKGASAATATSPSGEFRVTVNSSPATLVFSYLGMTTEERTVTGSANLTVLLGEQTGTLEDVVVVGYGTQRASKVSGAVSVVRAADIQKLVPVRIEEAIQGRASGVTVIQGGSPGSSPTIFVRGIPSFSGTDPLVIIDGVPQTVADLNSINPSDVESINVLKDAATTGIYGVKGGNGVIVVVTKSGRKNQRTEVSANANYGIQEVPRIIGVLNATEYAAIINEGSTVAGRGIIFPDLTKVGVGTNWQNEIFKKASFQSYNASVRGGSDKVTYFLSSAFINQGGIVGGNDKSRFNRGTFTANLDFYLTSKLKLVLNTTGVVLNGKGLQENSFNSIIGSALNYDPTVPVLNNNANTVGKYGFSNLILSEVFNPLTKLDNTYNQNNGNKLYGKFELQYDVIKELKLTSRFGYTKYDANSKSFTPLVFYGLNNVDNTMNPDGSTVTDRHNTVNHEKASNFGFTWETFGNYNFKVARDHTFETVLGLSLQKTSGNAAGASRQDVPFNSWEFADFNAATGTNTINNPNASNGYYYQYFRKNISLFGRVNYDYQGKYLASFSTRRDGSFAFGAKNKYAPFYAGSIGWVVSNEQFFKSGTINLLKIRGSYGSVGNENVAPQSNSIVTGGPSYASPVNSNGYTFNGVFYPGATLGSTVNEFLGWEKQIQLNVGFEVAILRNKMTLSADYYKKRVGGLLFRPTAPLVFGTIAPPDANIGNTETKGLDITLGFNQTISKVFNVNTAFTFTSAQNMVTATNEDGTARINRGNYFNGQSQSVTVFEKGQSPGYFYGYRTAGLFQSADEIAKSPIQNGAKPGDIKFVDMNGDGIINDLDRTKIGDPFPDFTMGWTLNLSYKGFDFTAFTYASVGNDMYKAWERNAIYTNKDRSVLGRWTGAGSTNDARYPRFTFNDDNSNIRVSDRYVEDGSFIKIKNLQLGYSLPKAGFTKLFSSCRLYVQVKNLYTFTKYTGFDPELPGGVLETGVDRGAYPQSRTYAVGLDFRL